MQHVKVPQDRLGVLIGEGGETMREIERRAEVRLDIDSESGSVAIDAVGAPVTGLVAPDIVRAIGRGFRPDAALSLLDDDMRMFDLIDIDDATRNKNDLQRQKGRLIGEDGRTRELMEELTGATVVIYGTTLGAIGTPQQVDAGDECPECGGEVTAGEGVEIGHIFKLGTRYSEPMGLTVDLADGSRQDVLMASYGIGIERLLYSLLDQHADEDGCRWSADGSGIVAPYAAAIIPLQYDDELAAVADYLYEDCGADKTLLFDDPDQSIGERFAESDLLGIPYKIIVGNEFRDTGEVELESRDGETDYVTVEKVPDRI